MSFCRRSQIAREIMKFAANGTLYRGSKPVMWSVVEKPRLPRRRSNMRTTQVTPSLSRFRCVVIADPEENWA